MADPSPLDLGREPARREADRPRGVGVDALALLDPVEEAPAHELDVAAHATAEVDEVDGHAIAVAIDQVSDPVDVGGCSGRGVDVDDEVVLLGHGEDAIELRRAVGVVGRAAEEEGGLERAHPALPGQGERPLGALGVVGLRRDPQRARDPLVGRGGLEHEVVQRERDLGVGHAVVRHDERALGALLVEVAQQVSHRGRGAAGRDDLIRQVVEARGWELAEVAVAVAYRRL